MIKQKKMGDVNIYNNPLSVIISLILSLHYGKFILLLLQE